MGKDNWGEDGDGGMISYGEGVLKKDGIRGGEFDWWMVYYMGDRKVVEEM